MKPHTRAQCSLPILLSILALPSFAEQPDRKELGKLLRAEAVCCGRISKIDSWVQAGADVDAQADYGETALFYVSSFGRTKAALRLLELGANPNIANDSDITPLQKAAADCNTKVVKALLDAGADVNFADHHGRTPLMKATISNCDGTVALLLSRREIKIHTTDESRKTAMDFATHPWIIDAFNQVINKNSPTTTFEESKLLP